MEIKVSTAPIFDENPFVERAIERIQENTVTKKRFLKGAKGVESIIVDGSNGEIKGHSAFVHLIEVDEDRFAKLYLSQFGAFWELDKASIRVFGYILSNLLPHKDIVYIDIEEAMKHTQYNSKKTIFTGLGKLISLGIIARSSNHMKYFINPMMFFNGDRVTFARTYVKKKKDKIDDPAQLKLEMPAV